MSDFRINDDERTSVKAKEAYARIDRDWLNEDQFDWDYVSSTFFNLKQKGGADDEDQRTLHVIARNAILDGVNRIATQRKANWRLFISMKNESVMKSAKDKMVSRMLTEKLKLLIRACDRPLEDLGPLRAVEGISMDDKMTIERFIDSGTTMKGVYFGLVSRLVTLDPKDRKELLEVFAENDSPMYRVGKLLN